MKRKVLAAALTLSMCFTPFTAFAAEGTSDITAEELLKKESEFSQNAKSMSMDMDMNFDFDFLMSNTSEDGTPQDFGLTMKMTADMLVEALMDPMTVSTTGTMEMETNTPGTEKETVDLNTYCAVSEDGTKMDVYSEDPETPGEWVHTQMDMTETLKQLGVSSLNEMMTKQPDLSMFGDMSDWKVSENDTEYEVSGQMKFSDMSEMIMPAILDSLGASGDETTETMVTTVVDTVLDCFVINLSYTLDKETCAAKAMHMDFNDSDLSALTDLIKSMLALSGDAEEMEGLDMNIALNDFTIDATCQYDTVDEITIPEEALNAEVFDINEAMAEAESELTE